MDKIKGMTMSKLIQFSVSNTHKNYQKCFFKMWSPECLVAQIVENLHFKMQEIWVRSLSQEEPPEGGDGCPLQYSSLEKPMDRGVWQATVPGVTKSWTRLND